MTDDPLISKYGTHKNGHSLFAPSASAGWLNCAGFLLANATAADDAGVDAAYGTIAHAVAERWHKLGRKPIKLLGRTEVTSAGGVQYSILIDDAMMEFVEEYINWCEEVPGDHYYEQRVDLSAVLPIPGQGGTADHFACEPFKLTITDLKMGTGVRVYAENNSQAMLYALGVFLEWDWIYAFQKIVIRICQPRLGVFETWTCSRQELLDFAVFVHERSHLAWQENAPRTPSAKACRWCKVSTTCAARLKHADDMLDAVFDGEDADESLIASIDGRSYSAAQAFRIDGLALPGFKVAIENREKFKRLSTTALSYVLTFRKDIEKLFKEMGEEVLKRAENGEFIPFQKLTDGRKKWIWTDKNKAISYIVDELGIEEEKAQPPTILSVSKMIGLIRAETKKGPTAIKKLLTENADIGYVSSKRSLADLQDERPDAFGLIGDIFEAETEDDEDEL